MLFERSKACSYRFVEHLQLLADRQPESLHRIQLPTGFNSGEYGGNANNTMFSATTSPRAMCAGLWDYMKDAAEGHQPARDVRWCVVQHHHVQTLGGNLR